MNTWSHTDAHYILWRDETVAVAHHVTAEKNSDFRGQLELVRIHPLLKGYWDWLHRQFYGCTGDGDEFIPMPGFIFEKWSVEYPDGTVPRSGMPLPDADYKMVTWRLRD